MTDKWQAVGVQINRPSSVDVTDNQHFKQNHHQIYINLF